MCIKGVFLIIFLAVHRSYGAVFLWSNYKTEISPLQSFSDESLEELIQDLGYPETTIYKSHVSLLPEFKQYLNGYYTAYNPNGDVDTENATEISSLEDLKLLNLAEKRSDKNVLSVLVIKDGRNKRHTSSSNMTETGTPPLQGPVLYKAKSTGKNLYAMLYSTKPLLLKTNSSQIYLGNTAPDLVMVDTYKDNYTRLNVKIHIEEENNLITLRFRYFWSPQKYWSLKAVKITDNANSYNFLDILSITEDVSAPAHFSYHCSGETIFIDDKGSVSLTVYDLQTQIDSPSENKFSDAYDCVDFISVPILSGLFVSAFLGIGLIIALIAIGDIKTMDKFDNYKTKQLVITVSE